jgi:tetratricopeptide (TPR) repeat protein
LASDYALACADLLKRIPGDPPILLEAARTCLSLGQLQQAFEALDRLLVIAPSNAEAWEQLAAVLARADKDVAFLIGLRAQSAGKTSIVVSALSALIAMSASPHHIEQILPDADRRVSLDDEYWGAVLARLDALQLAAVARCVETIGRLDAAEALLRQAITIAPKRVELHLELALYLERRERFAIAEATICHAIDLAPGLAEPRRVHARLLNHLARYDDAAKSITALLDIAPSDPRTWLDFGQLARYSYVFPPDAADAAFTRAAELAGDGDLLALETSARYFYDELKFAAALRSFDLLLGRSPDTFNNPGTCREYARCLRACDRDGNAAAIIRRGLDRCEVIARLSEGENWELIKREEVLLLLEAGEPNKAEAVLQLIRDRADVSAPNYNRTEYLPSTPERLRRLEALVRSRDVIVFLPGPSFADFASRLSDVADLDFATAGVNSFPPVEEKLLDHMGRGLDLLTISHPAMVDSWKPELHEFLCRPTLNLLLTTSYALSGLPKLAGDDGFISRHDDRLLFAYPAGGPPLPSRPLHFAAVNTLNLMMPLLVLARPRRIFLVGADGGGHPRYNRPYFFYDDIDREGSEQDFLQRPHQLGFKGRPARLEEANRRLRVDAINSGNLTRDCFVFLQALFGFPIPPVFNVCPHSAYEAFPRIDCDTAIAMLRD